MKKEGFLSGDKAPRDKFEFHTSTSTIKLLKLVTASNFYHLMVMYIYQNHDHNAVRYWFSAGFCYLNHAKSYRILIAVFTSYAKQTSRRTSLLSRAL